jgi:hypothetical protein
MSSASEEREFEAAEYHFQPACGVEANKYVE